MLLKNQTINYFSFIYSWTITIFNLRPYPLIQHKQNLLATPAHPLQNYNLQFSCPIKRQRLTQKFLYSSPTSFEYHSSIRKKALEKITSQTHTYRTRVQRNKTASLSDSLPPNSTPITSQFEYPNHPCSLTLIQRPVTTRTP